MNFSSVIFNKYYNFCYGILHNYNIMMYIYTQQTTNYTALFTVCRSPIDFSSALCYNITESIMPKRKNEMKEKIIAKLTEIEKTEQVRILYCAESGSRATGLSSEDSDYDARFIYIRNEIDYLKLEPMRDVIEWQCDDTFDVCGWDIKKALTLAYRSNPALLEWISSPIVYKETEDWKPVAEAIKEFFSQKKALMHYLSMAKSNYDSAFKTENIKFKKYFYVLRPLLSAEWVLTKNEMPPLEFEKLTALLPEGEITDAVTTLIQAKRSGSKKMEGAPLPHLNEYIESHLTAIDTAANTLPAPEHKDISALDKIFLSLLDR